MDLDLFFTKDQIIKVKATEKQLVFKEMIGKLQDLGLIENKDRYYAQIVHRESLENTGIGNGFAIPHTRTETVSKFISIFGILNEPVDYQSLDGNPVEYVLLSIFPSELSTKYLYLIGMMARIFSNAEKKNNLDNNRTPAKFYSILHKEAAGYFNSLSDVDNSEYNPEENLQGVPSSDLDLIIRLDRLYNAQKEKGNTELTRKIDDLKKLIDNRSLTYYERMKKKRHNPFSIVEKNSCSGCHMQIPPIHLKEIKERKGIPVCTHCGRFLIIV
ncbi:MAG TPA: PTS sugar transporter subunit IIA [Spirochaetota bacterium]|nr:PTS sugar transporter subunit IIA [Spirochaetota bacterium]HPI90543.1 PTS sugar transporter subunit IIA [Spirochaetota bacterium]HPR49132.1 PTS sugar transporter subunit IIA [Spirochaetota bacterium]